jgi:enamine deaminase RidA (YjgF/YER057c/UK114 family)
MHPTTNRSASEEAAVPVELLNPAGLPAPEVYRQVAVATGSRLVFLAGQVARDADGAPVGAGDLAAQVEQAYLNVGTALAAVGGSFDDVAKVTLYIVDWSGEKLPALGEGVARAAARLGADLTKPVTLIPVAALGEPDLLIEVDATAVLP